MLTAQALEFFHCRVTQPEWSDLEGRPILRRGSLVRSAAAVRLDSITGWRLTEASGEWQDVHQSEPRPVSTFELHLAEELGDLGRKIRLPLHDDMAPYDSNAPVTPEDDAAEFREMVMDLWRGSQSQRT